MYSCGELYNIIWGADLHFATGQGGEHLDGDVGVGRRRIGPLLLDRSCIQYQRVCKGLRCVEPDQKEGGCGNFEWVAICCDLISGGNSAGADLIADLTYMMYVRVECELICTTTTTRVVSSCW